MEEIKFFLFIIGMKKSLRVMWFVLWFLLIVERKVGKKGEKKGWEKSWEKVGGKWECRKKMEKKDRMWLKF